MTCSVSQQFGLGSLQAAVTWGIRSGVASLCIMMTNITSSDVVKKKKKKPTRKRWYLKRYIAFAVPGYDLYGDRCPCEANDAAVHTEPGGSILWAQDVPRPRSHQQMSCFTYAAYLQTGTGTWRRRVTPERISHFCKSCRSFPCRWLQSSRALKRCLSLRISVHSVMTLW